MLKLDRNFLLASTGAGMALGSLWNIAFPTPPIQANTNPLPVRKEYDSLTTNYTFAVEPAKKKLTDDSAYRVDGINALIDFANERATFLAEVRGTGATLDDNIPEEVLKADQDFKDRFFDIAAGLIDLRDIEWKLPISDQTFIQVYKELRAALAQEKILLIGERYDIDTLEDRTTLDFNYRVFPINSAQRETHTVWGEKLSSIVINTNREMTSFKDTESKDLTSNRGHYGGYYIHSNDPTIIIFNNYYSGPDSPSYKATKDHEFGHLHDAKHFPKDSNDPFTQSILREQYAFATEFSRLNDRSSQLYELAQGFTDPSIESHNLAHKRAAQIVIDEIIKDPKSFGLDPEQIKSPEDVARRLSRIKISEQQKATLALLIKDDVKKTRQSIAKLHASEDTIQDSASSSPTASFPLLSGLLMFGAGVFSSRYSKKLRQKLLKNFPENQRSEALSIAADIAPLSTSKTKQKALQKLYKHSLTYAGTTQGAALEKIFKSALPYEPEKRFAIMMPVLMERPAVRKQIIGEALADAIAHNEKITPKMLDSFIYNLGLYGKHTESPLQELIKYGLQECLISLQGRTKQ